jgi:CheY-like chemotaxis protein
MSRILLVDDSPHAQRMGERILSDEGFEVVTVTTAESALIRLDDVDPDVVVADTVMPGRNGFDICYYLKISPRHKHVRVILTAGVLDALDEAQVQRVEADCTLRKPFEASALLAAVKPLAEAATAARTQTDPTGGPEPSGAEARLPGAPKGAPFIALVDSEQVRAAVTVALDAAMGAMVEEISQRVVAALATRHPDSRVVEQPSAPVRAPIKLEGPAPTPSPAPPPAPAPPAVPHTETVRRVTPLRVRSSSLLGLDLTSLDPPDGR